MPDQIRAEATHLEPGKSVSAACAPSSTVLQHAHLLAIYDLAFD